MHMAAVKGVGVDCVQLVGQVMVVSGVGPSYDFGRYPLDWGQRSAESLVVAYTEGTGYFERLEPTEPAELGDILCFQIGQCVDHSGLAVSERRFAHAFAKRRVTWGRLDDPTWSKRLACLYRAL